MTTVTRRDYHNMLLLLFTQIVAVVVGIMTFTLVTRLLEVSERGRFSFATSTTIFVTLLAELGMRYVVMREIANDIAYSRNMYRHTVMTRLLFSTLSILALLLLVQLIVPWRSEATLLPIAGLGAVCQFSSEPAAWVFLAQNKMMIYSGIQVIDRFLYLIIVCIVAIIFRTAEALLWAIVAANLIRMLVSWIWLRISIPEESSKKAWDAKLFKRLILDGGTLGVAAIVSVTYSQFTIVLLQAQVAPQELGIYSVAFGLVSLLSVVPIALTSAIFPSLSRQNSPSEIASLYAFITRINLSAIFPLVGGLVMFAPLSVLIFGGRYEAAVLEIRILSIGMIALSLNYVYRMFLFTQQRSWTETIADGLAIILIAVLSIAFCPQYGGLAMAIIFSGVEFGLLLIKIILTWNWMGKPPYVEILIRATFATLFAALSTTLFAILMLKLLVYGLVCGTLLFTFRVVPPIDWQNQLVRLRILIATCFESH